MSTQIDVGKLSEVEFDQAIRSLVDESRQQCLWFMKEDYYPETASEILRVLESVENHSDRKGYVKARYLKEWLLQNTSGRYAV